MGISCAADNREKELPDRLASRFCTELYNENRAEKRISRKFPAMRRAFRATRRAKCVARDASHKMRRESRVARRASRVASLF